MNQLNIRGIELYVLNESALRDYTPSRTQLFWTPDLCYYCQDVCNLALKKHLVSVRKIPEDGIYRRYLQNFVRLRKHGVYGVCRRVSSLW